MPFTLPPMIVGSGLLWAVDEVAHAATWLADLTARKPVLQRDQCWHGASAHLLLIGPLTHAITNRPDEGVEFGAADLPSSKGRVRCAMISR